MFDPITNKEITCNSNYNNINTECFNINHELTYDKYDMDTDLIPSKSDFDDYNNSQEMLKMFNKFDMIEYFPNIENGVKSFIEGVKSVNLAKNSLIDEYCYGLYNFANDYLDDKFINNLINKFSIKSFKEKFIKILKNFGKDVIVEDIIKFTKTYKITSTDMNVWLASSQYIGTCKGEHNINIKDINKNLEYSINNKKLITHFNLGQFLAHNISFYKSHQYRLLDDNELNNINDQL